MITFLVVLLFHQSLALQPHQISLYWIAEQPRDDVAEVTLLDINCEPIASVSRAFQRRLNIEGTGALNDGPFVNVAGRAPCGKGGREVSTYRVVPHEIEFGYGVRGHRLRQFKTVAVDPSIIPIGTRLYIPALDGMRLPPKDHAPLSSASPRRHDGCVVAGDIGSGVKGRQLDLFIGWSSHRKRFYQLTPTLQSVWINPSKCPQSSRRSRS